jgi:hypothetical protein
MVNSPLFGMLAMSPGLIAMQSPDLQKKMGELVNNHMHDYQPGGKKAAGVPPTAGIGGAGGLLAALPALTPLLGMSMLSGPAGGPNNAFAHKSVTAPCNLVTPGYGDVVSSYLVNEVAASPNVA